MKKMLLFLGILLTSQLAAAQFGGGGFEADPCSGTYVGTWAYKGGRQMTLKLNRLGRERITMEIIHKDRGSSVANGVCQVDRFSGQAQLFTDHGNLNLANDQATGVVDAFLFTGSKVEDAVPPAPTLRDLCQGTITGTWILDARKQIAMTVMVARTSAPDRRGNGLVSVTVVQKAGSEAMGGSCELSRMGTATLRFEGINGGTLTVQSTGAVSGSVATKTFNGFLN